MPQRKRRCVCQDRGSFECGIPGILAGLPFQDGVRYIERCDACERFASDDDAGFEYVRLKGGLCVLDCEKRMVWIPGWLFPQVLSIY
jgi:hypothetical protein